MGKEILVSTNPRVYDEETSSDEEIQELVLVYDNSIIELIGKIELAISDGYECENILVFISSSNEDLEDIRNLIHSIYKSIKYVTDI